MRFVAPLMNAGRAVMVVSAVLAVSACAAVPEFAKPDALYSENYGKQKSKLPKGGVHEDIGDMPVVPEKVDLSHVVEELAGDKTNRAYTGDVLKGGTRSDPPQPETEEGIRPHPSADIKQTPLPPVSAEQPATNETDVTEPEKQTANPAPAFPGLAGAAREQELEAEKQRNNNPTE